jgi:hypothetical protein
LRRFKSLPIKRHDLLLNGRFNVRSILLGLSEYVEHEDSGRSLYAADANARS